MKLSIAVFWVALMMKDGSGEEIECHECALQGSDCSSQVPCKGQMCLAAVCVKKGVVFTEKNCITNTDSLGCIATERDDENSTACASCTCNTTWCNGGNMRSVAYDMMKLMDPTLETGGINNVTCMAFLVMAMIFGLGVFN